MKDIKFLLKKKKSDNRVVDNTKMYQQMKNKTLLGIEKKCCKTASSSYKKLLF